MATCGEYLMALLEAYGIDTAFGIPGTHTIELYRGLPQTTIRHMAPRHEQGAGFMADGYARVSGRPAACLTISGPGGLNIATAMGQALADSVPMLVISADNASYQHGLGEGRLHETNNLSGAMAQCSRWAHTVLRPDDLPRLLARAFSIMQAARPGPVHLTIPQDVITADASHCPVETWPLASRPAADRHRLHEAAHLLNAAMRPVMALGGGAVEAAAAVRQLAERLDAPVTATHNARGILPPDHPLYIATSPSFDAVRDLYRDADVIVAIGTEFGETDYDFFLSGRFDLGEAKLIRIDIEAAQLARNVRADLPICADSGSAVADLLPLIAPKKKPGDGAKRAAQTNQAAGKNHHCGYQGFLHTLAASLRNGILIGDSTLPAYFAAAQYHPPTPRSFFCASTGYGTLGYALPAALGAKLASPERPVIAVLGDGGIQFTLNELATAVQAQLPIAIIVWNNNGYDMIAQNFRDAGLEPMACDPHQPDFMKLAESYGCHGTRVGDLVGLQAALRAASTRPVPTLIEVREHEMLAENL